MTQFNFYYPIQVRYSDLDTQWHVNNIQFCVYLEQARIEYLINLGLFDGKSFHDLGLIVASIQVSYRAPIELKDQIRVGVRVSKMGNKSLVFSYQVEGMDGKMVYATGESVMVAYNYREKVSIPLPDTWRETMAAFDGIPPRS